MVFIIILLCGGGLHFPIATQMGECKSVFFLLRFGQHQDAKRPLLFLASGLVAPHFWRLFVASQVDFESTASTIPPLRREEQFLLKPLFKVNRIHGKNSRRPQLFSALSLNFSASRRQASRFIRFRIDPLFLPKDSHIQASPFCFWSAFIQNTRFANGHGFVIVDERAMLGSRIRSRPIFTQQHLGAGPKAG